MSSEQSPRKLFTVLRQFVREKAPLELCEICSAALLPEHPHLVELSSRQLICTCDACAVRFSDQGDDQYRRVPRRIQFLRDFHMTDVQWESLMLPVGMAFFFKSTSAGKVAAFYPSPAGATESLLSLESWEEILENNPVLKGMKPDVEAFLVNRIGSAREYYLVPIDACYELVGIIRLHWRGFSGGSKVWEEIGRFFDRLKEKSAGGTPASPPPRGDSYA